VRPGAEHPPRVRALPRRARHRFHLGDPGQLPRREARRGRRGARLKRRILALAALAALGLALEALDVVDWSALLEWARAHAGDWRLPPAIVLAQSLLYTFGQPGSILFWAAAPLYSAPVATLILTTGGTAGALGAYLFARRLTRLHADRARGQRLFAILGRQADFFTLCALRVLPGMPHSAINYAAGALLLPLPRFLAATALGLAVKSYLYSSAVGAIAGSAGPSDLLRLEVLGPLFAIALLLLLGRLAYRR
jgi:uncharacterized membrane protein YdjX (TVP38/TMEM64 family)